MTSANNLNDFQLELGGNSELGMALAIATMMFAVALNLKPSSFAFIKSSPKSFLTGVAGQMLALPLLSLSLCFLLEPMPSVALGMILISCCPGGNVSNLLVLLARGNAALSVTLTATSSLAAAFVTPIAILFWSGLYPPTSQLLTQIAFDRGQFLLQTSLILALPLILGLLINSIFPKVAALIRRPLVLLASLLLLSIIVTATARYWDDFLSLGSTLLGLVLLHNGLAFLVGNVLSRWVGLNSADRRSITFEVGIQNAGLGIVILLSQLGGLGGAAAVLGLWGTWHIIAGLILVLYFRTCSEVKTVV